MEMCPGGSCYGGRLSSDQLTLQLLNSGAYSNEEVAAAAGRAKDFSDVALVVDENGHSRVPDLDPKDLAKANSADAGERGSVTTGIERLGEELHTTDLDVRETSENGFIRGNGVAKPADGAAPDDAWRG